jgi:hypothetical protein
MLQCVNKPVTMQLRTDLAMMPPSLDSGGTLRVLATHNTKTPQETVEKSALIRETDATLCQLQRDATTITVPNDMTGISTDVKTMSPTVGKAVVMYDLAMISENVWTREYQHIELPMLLYTSRWTPGPERSRCPPPPVQQQPSLNLLAQWEPLRHPKSLLLLNP